MDHFPSAENTPAEKPQRRIWKIGEITRRIKAVLEDHIGNVWVEGEISNLRRPQSGHAYFTLKDATAQIQAVMFRSALAAVKTPLKDGALIRAFGRITVYEASGNYQINVIRIEIGGEGELALRFEALKKQLAAEGLFAEDRKQPLPLLPQHVGIVTSATGAAIRDILNVIGRRYANIHLLIAPVKVQGEGAAQEIADAIDVLNARGGLDVLIVGRGGGSLEDLWCFNEEVVIRAIARSKIPIISAVGHEIDHTLSDLAADLRAPTPSAAAEILVKGKTELQQELTALTRRLLHSMQSRRQELRHRLDRAAAAPLLKDPLQQTARLQQRVDLLSLRLQTALAGLPRLTLERTSRFSQRMQHALDRRLEAARRDIAAAEAKLRLLDPKAVLRRGYTLTYSAATGEILRSAAQTAPGAIIRTEWADGATLSTINPPIPKNGDAP